MVGDPSGRTDMRQFMTIGTVQENSNAFKKLFDRFIEFDEEYVYTGGIGDGKSVENKSPEPGKAIAVNNAQWLLPLNYVDFIRDIGRHFSVNNMLRAECFKQRLEKGLSFLEFNYMLMQSYDFMVMARDIEVKMQFGGNDQWSNILGGIDLCRRELNKQVYGMTFSLLTTSDGKKMGKTQAGALWLDETRTSPYEFYQYWRNVEDADVNKCLRMLTFLPMDEVNRLSSLEGADINKAKEILAYEVTKLVHGEEKAKIAQEGAKAAFSGGTDKNNIPGTVLERSLFEGDGYGLVNLLKDTGLVSSNSDGFRNIKQGGVTVGGEKVSDTKMQITLDMFKEDGLLLQKGKKTFHMVKLK